jgi:hypothetical protein
LALVVSCRLSSSCPKKTWPDVDIKMIFAYAVVCAPRRSEGHEIAHKEHLGVKYPQELEKTEPLSPDNVA